MSYRTHKAKGVKHWQAYTNRLWKERELALEREKRIAEWTEERKTRSYEPPSPEIVAECPFELGERYIELLRRRSEGETAWEELDTFWFATAGL